ncbi:MAG: DUF3048 domain-containing protein [Candidatus Saccharimonadales bacterium]
MNDDIRLPKERHPISTPETNIDQKPAGEGSEVDEHKLEQEFGPPPEEAPPTQSRTGKLLLLLPSFKRKNLKREHLIAAAVVAILIIVGLASFLTLHFYQPKPVPVAVVKRAAPMIPATVPSTLTGLPVAPNVNQRPVTAIIIENIDAARPQSGLDQAGVVFEALTEGGITRFMALYQDTQPSYIGPIRSLRPYYIEWALGFNAAIAHVGGSPQALSDVTVWTVKDLNEFYNGGSYERISSREAPHNVYTSIAKLNQLETNKGYTTSTYTGFVRKIAAPVKSPNVTSINMSFSSSDFAVAYAYNAKTNSYERSEGGAQHMELNADGSQVQIAPKVVIGMVVPYSTSSLDSSGAYYSVYNVIGSGPVYIFQDGTVETGTWTKSSDASQITFTNSSGQTIGLDPGQTWISILASSQDLTYN